MRTTVRIAAPLAVSLALASFGFAVYQVQLERQTLRADLSLRVSILTADLQQSLEPFEGIAEDGLSTLERFSQRDYVKSVAVMTGRERFSRPYRVRTRHQRGFSHRTRAGQLDTGR